MISGCGDRDYVGYGMDKWVAWGLHAGDVRMGGKGGLKGYFEGGGSRGEVPLLRAGDCGLGGRGVGGVVVYWSVDACGSDAVGWVVCFGTSAWDDP